MVGGRGEGVCRQAEENLAEHSVSAVMLLLKVDPRDVHDRKKWRAIGWNPAVSGTPS